METSGQRSSMSAMQFALEALDSDNPDMQLRAAIALRQALETEQEPATVTKRRGLVSRSAMIGQQEKKDAA